MTSDVPIIRIRFGHFTYNLQKYNPRKWTSHSANWIYPTVSYAISFGTKFNTVLPPTTTAPKWSLFYSGFTT